MKSFKQYITEAYMPRLKGWGNSETGKLELTPIKGKFKPYHQQFAANNLSKFKLKEKDVIDYIHNEYGSHRQRYQMHRDDFGAEIFNDIKKGNIDRDNAFGDLMKKKGWYPIVFDKGINSIGDTLTPSPKRMLKIARAVDKQYGIELWDDAYAPKMEVGGADIYNRYDWEQYLKSGRIAKKTNIGSTMAQFREETEDEII